MTKRGGLHTHWTFSVIPGPSHGAGVHRFLGIYTALGMGAVVALAIQSVTASSAIWRASSKIHESMLSSILRAPMAFFVSQ